MNVLIIGSGGREHALAWKLAQSQRIQMVYVAPGNGGTEQDPRLKSVPFTDPQWLAQFAIKEHIGLTVVGPEAALAAGAKGGLLTPSLTIGALLATILGGLWSAVWPAAPLAAFALIGATAFLAAARSMPLTAIVLMLASPLVAQVPPPAPAPAPTVITRSLTLEWIIVTVMIGAVLFAVCRSSRRN